jgi:chromosome transmission fidelity protein 18
MSWTPILQRLSGEDAGRSLEGLFHNYLKVQFSDPTFERACDALEWLSFADVLDHKSVMEQSFFLQAYVPFAGIAMRLNCAMPRKTRMELPKIFYALHQRKGRTENILRAFQDAAVCASVRGVSQGVLSCQVVSHLLDILAPAIRPVNMQLLTPKEKKELADLVDTLVATRLTFTPKHEHYGYGSSTTAYELDPDLPQVVNFSRDTETAEFITEASSKFKYGGANAIGGAWGAEQPIMRRPTANADPTEERRELASGLKQYVAREVEMEQMRRLEQRLAGAILSSPSKAGPSVSSVEGDVEMGEASVLSDTPSVDLGNKRNSIHERNAQLLKEANEVTFKDAPRKATFLNAHRDAHRIKDVRKGYNMMHFSFHEGFTNAVRRTVHIKHFF